MNKVKILNTKKYRSLFGCIVILPFILGNILGCEPSPIDQTEYLNSIEQANLSQSRYELEIREHLVIDPGTGDGLLGAPRVIAVDEYGNIFVADHASMSIKVFDKSGRYLRKIGSRGREPGQFMDLSIVYIDDKSRLITIDDVNQRVSIFNTGGEIKSYHKTDPDILYFPKEAKKVKAEEFVILNKMPPRYNSDFIAHSYDEDIEINLSSFITLEELGQDYDLFGDLHYLVEPGSIYPLSSSRFIYTPSIYEGKVYIYEFLKGNWSQNEVWEGRKSENKIVEVMDEKPPACSWVLYLSCKWHICSWNCSSCK